MTLVTLNRFVIGVVLLGWGLFGLAFVTRPRSAPTAVRLRDRTSLLGIAIQCAGYALVWGTQRPTDTTIVPTGMLGAAVLLALTSILALSSGWLAVSAVRTLGKQWSLTARVLEAHALITHGPYMLVRHPIYTAMFGLLVATGLALSRWPALLVGAAVFAVGTLLRVRTEEQLLRRSFGEEYDRYARRVPALCPWPRSSERHDVEERRP